MADQEALDRALEFLYEDEDDSQPKSRRGRPQPAKSRAPAASRHDRKCNVCRHSHRESIEHDFLMWRSPGGIAEKYGIADHSSIYRHAHATGLFAKRAGTIKLALSPLIEQAMVVPVTADSIVRAVVAFAHLNDHGEWVNPPKRVVHESRRSHHVEPQRAVPDSSAAPQDLPTRRTQIESNRQTISSATDASR